MPDLFEPERSLLENGLRVISLRLPGASTVGAVLAVDVGGADEPDPICGVSHFLEHLVFRATEHYDTSAALGAAIEGVGGYFNAFTSKTVTAYLAAAPLEHFRLAASIPAELVIRPLLREPDIDEERPVVLREISLSEDNASRRALHALERLVWHGTGYARPILGFPETLAACTQEPVRAYWRERYAPERAVFALAGDVEHAEAVAVARDLAGGWRASDGYAPADGAAGAAGAGAESSRLHVEPMDRQRVELWVGVRTPSFPQANRAELEAVASLAAGGKGSHLTRVLLQERGLVLRVSAFNWLHRSDGMLAVTATAEPAKAGDAAAALVGELLRLHELPDPDCARAIAFARGEYARSWAEPLDSATRVAEEALWLDETPSRAADRAAFAALTPDSVREAARRLFSPERLCLSVVGPGVERPVFEAALAGS